ncbi:MAG: GNAT family N-acetyltransferase [Candidatus Bathyarchaeia archaeon]|jgi:aminoglycoside 6'-N-acetyltransferase I
MNIRKLSKDENIPYNLLLLADETVEAINRYIFDSDIFVLEESSQIIAVYALQKLDAETVEIKNIAVTLTFQGRGLGKLLLNDAADRAKAQGFKAVLIGTGDATKQLALYQKMGFKRVGIRRNFYVDNYPKPIFENGVQLKDMVVLKKELP